MEFEMNTKKVLELIRNGSLDHDFIDIYVDAEQLEYQKERYIHAVMKFTEWYGEADIQIFSAPGRSEIGGNHTDHQHGEVLATSINYDAIGIVKKNAEDKVRVVSDDLSAIEISLDDLGKKESEKGTTKAIIKGVLAGFVERGYNIGGFQAYITSYVNGVRLNYAVSLLDSTNKPITEICFESGFESQRTFNRVFKERYKVTPSEYRTR